MKHSVFRSYFGMTAGPHDHTTGLSFEGVKSASLQIHSIHEKFPFNWGAIIANDTTTMIDGMFHLISLTKAGGTTISSHPPQHTPLVESASHSQSQSHLFPKKNDVVNLQSKLLLDWYVNACIM